MSDAKENIIVVLNPLANDGKAAKQNEIILEVLRVQFPEIRYNLVILDKPIPSEAERARQLADAIQIYQPTHVFVGGGDGTILKTAQNILLHAEKDPKNFHKAQWPNEITFVPIGMGSAEDLRTALAFPKPQNLGGFLNDVIPTVPLGAVWMMDSNGENPVLINHSVAFGVGSSVFALRDQRVREWKVDPKNAGKELPWYLSSIWGRLLAIPKAWLVDFQKEYGGKGLHVEVTLANGEVKNFPGTNLFAVLNLPLTGGAVGLPAVNPAAGSGQKSLMIALPFWTGGCIFTEGLVRGAAARVASKFGLTMFIGPDSKNWTLEALNRLAPAWMWDPDCVQVLGPQSGIVSARFFKQKANGELVSHATLATVNGDVVQTPMLGLQVLMTGQPIPFAAKTDSIVGNLVRNQKPVVSGTEYHRDDKIAVARMCIEAAKRNQLQRVRDLEEVMEAPSQWNRLLNQVPVAMTDPTFAAQALAQLPMQPVYTPPAFRPMPMMHTLMI